MKLQHWILLLGICFLPFGGIATESHLPDPIENLESDDLGPSPTEAQRTSTKPDLEEILRQLDPHGPRGNGRDTLVESYVAGIKDLPEEKLLEAITRFFNTTPLPEDRDLLTKGLLQEGKLDAVEKAAWAISPRTFLRLLPGFPKDAQKRGFERGLEEVRKNPKPSSLSTLAQAARITGYEFNREDLARFIFEAKHYDPYFLSQFAKNNPEGTQRLVDLFTQTSGNDRSSVFPFFQEVRDGQIALNVNQLKQVRAFVANHATSPELGKEAFFALKAASPELANSLLEELSQSEDAKDLVKAAGLLPFQSPKIEELLSQAVRSADSATLDLIAKEFPKFEFNLTGFERERLKTLAEWGLKTEAEEKGAKVFGLALEGLSKSASPAEVLPLMRAGMEKFPNQTLWALDQLDPKAAKQYGEFAPLAMKEIMASLNGIPRTGVSLQISGVQFLANFPSEIEAHGDELSKEVGGLWGTTALQLLGATQNPKYLSAFLSQVNSVSAMKSFAASEALGKLLKANPSLLNPEMEKQLKTVLEAKDEKDVARLHLRQHLPETLVSKLEQQILDEQKVDPARYEAVKKQATQAALDHLKREDLGMMGVGQRALALEYLVRSGHPDAGKMVDDFLKTVFPKGYIHNINAVQGLILATKEAGISLDPETQKKVQDRMDREARRLWNSRNPEVRIPGEDSNMIPYGGAAYVASAPDPENLNETQKALLAELRKMKGQPVPYHFPKEDEPKESGALLDPAPTSGRAVTLGLADYLTAGPEEKKESAQSLLGAARTFVAHFSQTHEIPRGSDRTHDRTPGGQQMAAYYGFANDPSLARALTLLSRETSLSPSERQEALTLSTRVQTQLLSLTNSDGVFQGRASESFKGENQAYLFLMGITLEQLQANLSPPRERLLQQVRPSFR